MTSDALDLEPGVFSLEDPRRIALSLKESAEASRRRKAGPFARIHRAVGEETLRLENGGPGLPGEGVTRPQGQAPETGPTAPARTPWPGRGI